MSILELFITAVALSMDAFAVAICKGLSVEKVRLKHALITGAWFGGFQMLMPVTGFFCASLFADYITEFDHWVAFALLLAIGFVKNNRGGFCVALTEHAGFSQNIGVAGNIG